MNPEIITDEQIRKSAPYTDAQIRIGRALRELVEARQLTHTGVAQGIGGGISAALVGNIVGLKHKHWPAVSSQHWEQVAKYLRQAARPKHKQPLSDYIALPVTLMIKSNLAICLNQSDIGLIYGIAGGGKTYAAHQFQKEEAHVYYSCATPASNTVFSFFQQIARDLNLAGSVGAFRTQALILNRLAAVKAPRLLIIDEAHHLSQPCIDAARCVYDALNQNSPDGFGMALIGNTPILAQIRRKAASAQIISRIGRTIRIDSAGNENVAALLEAVGGDSENKPLFRACLRVGEKAGALRRVVKVLRDAAVLAQAEGGGITVEHVEIAERERVADRDAAAA